VVQVEELAVVLGPLRGSLIEERPAEELVLDLASQTTSRFAGDLEFFVGVVVEGGVLSHFVVGDSDPRGLEDSVAFAGLVSFQAETFEVVHPLSVHKLDELTSGASVRVAQLTLQGHVVVLDGSASETMLQQTDSV
jgi:hypothetical protein